LFSASGEKPRAVEPESGGNLTNDPKRGIAAANDLIGDRIRAAEESLATHIERRAKYDLSDVIGHGNRLVEGLFRVGSQRFSVKLNNCPSLTRLRHGPIIRAAPGSPS
jgi:hypothetical protein